MFEEHLALGKEEQDALAIAVAELVENVHRHSHGRTPGFLVAQVHPTGPSSTSPLLTAGSA